MINIPDRNSLYGLVGRALQYVGQLGMVLILPKTLQPESYLEFNLILPAAFLGCTALFGWLTGSIFRYAHDLLDTNQPEYRETVFSYYLCAVAILTLIFLPLTLLFDSAYTLVPFLIIAAALKEGIVGVLNASERYRDFMLCAFGFMISLITLLVTCQLHGDEQLWLPILIYGMLDILTGLIFWNRSGIFAISTKPRFHKELAIRFLGYGGPIVLNSAFTWIISLSDRYLLKFWEPSRDVATYILTYQFSGSVITVPMAFIMTLVYPKVLRINKEEGHDAAMAYVSRCFTRFLHYSLPAGIVAISVIIPFMTVFFDNYSIDPILIVVLISAHVIMSASYFVNKEFELDGRTILLSRALILAALTNVFCNLMLIPILGSLGAAIATLIAYLVMVSLIYQKNSVLRIRRPASDK